MLPTRNCRQLGRAALIMDHDRPAVLMAEDNVGARAALSSRLVSRGSGAVFAPDVPTTIEALERHPGDANVWGVSIPAEDGFAVSEYI
jgi:hypothetical protein